MSAHTAAAHASGAHGHDEGHVHHHYTTTGLDNRKIAVWTFIGSECMLFASLISTYLIYKGKSIVGPFPHTAWTSETGQVFKPILDIPVTSASTFVLLMSSFAMVLALQAVREQQHPLRRREQVRMPVIRNRPRRAPHRHVRPIDRPDRRVRAERQLDQPAQRPGRRLVHLVAPEPIPRRRRRERIPRHVPVRPATRPPRRVQRIQIRPRHVIQIPRKPPAPPIQPRLNPRPQPHRILLRAHRCFRLRRCRGHGSRRHGFRRASRPRLRRDNPSVNPETPGADRHNRHPSRHHHASPRLPLRAHSSTSQRPLFAFYRFHLFTFSPFCPFNSSPSPLLSSISSFLLHHPYYYPFISSLPAKTPRVIRAPNPPGSRPPSSVFICGSTFPRLASSPIRLLREIRG